MQFTARHSFTITRTRTHTHTSASGMRDTVKCISRSALTQQASAAPPPSLPREICDLFGCFFPHHRRSCAHNKMLFVRAHTQRQTFPFELTGASRVHPERRGFFPPEHMQDTSWHSRTLHVLTPLRMHTYKFISFVSTEQGTRTSTPPSVCVWALRELHELSFTVPIPPYTPPPHTPWGKCVRVCVCVGAFFSVGACLCNTQRTLGAAVVVAKKTPRNMRWYKLELPARERAAPASKLFSSSSRTRKTAPTRKWHFH